MIEKRLIQELKEGNVEVLKHVYVHLDMIVSFVTKNSGTEEDAQDLFQDAVIVFHRSAIKRDFQLTSSIRTYLYSICKRMWFNKLKVNKRKLNGLSEYSDETIVEAFDFELASAISTELSYQINSVLDEIGETCKKILHLFYFKKLSQEQICEELNYSSSQVVRQQKYRCLKKVKEKLGVKNDLTSLM